MAVDTTTFEFYQLITHCVFFGHPYLSLLHLPAFGTRSRLSLFSW